MPFLKLHHLSTYFHSTHTDAVLSPALSPSAEKRETNGCGTVRMIYGAPALHGSHSFGIAIFVLAFQECWCSDTHKKVQQFPDTRGSHLKWHGTKKAAAPLTKAAKFRFSDFYTSQCEHYPASFTSHVGQMLSSLPLTTGFFFFCTEESLAPKDQKLY